MGATQANRIQIFLANQPRLLREMLHLALSQLVENATVTEVEEQDITPDKVNSGVTNWIVMTPRQNRSADERAGALLSKQPELHIVMLGFDARSIQIFTTKDGTTVQNKTYTDFSLRQLIDIFGGAAHA